jgi:ArsR family transcriptional regulator
MAISQLLKVLKTAADPTRLRLLALLAAGEATVGELVDVLGQSQPRVSRHLKLLSDARLVEHFRDGQWMYYRRSPGNSLLDLIVASARAGDGTIESDRQRMSEIRRRREHYAHAVPTGPRRWAEPASERPDESALRQALVESLGAGPLGDVLDVGTGSGTVLRLLGARASQAVGLDAARGMRVLARSRLQEAGLAQCTIRSGDMHALAFPDHSFDIVVLDEVLSLTERPLRVLQEAARVLRPAGRLLLLDRIVPAVRRLPAQSSQRVLFENQLNAMLRSLGLRLTQRAWLPGRKLEQALFTAAATVRARTGTDE